MPEHDYGTVIIVEKFKENSCDYTAADADVRRQYENLNFVCRAL